MCIVHCPTPNTLPLGCVGFQFLLNLFSQTECDGSGASDTSISGGRPHRPHGTLSASLIKWGKLHRRQKQNVVLLNLLRDFKNQIELNCFIKTLQEMGSGMESDMGLIGKCGDQSTAPTQGMTFKINTFELLSQVLCVFIKCTV